MRVLVVANTHAGGGRADGRLDLALAELRRQAHAVEVVATDYPGHGEAIVAQRAGDTDLIVAAGGDGTVGEAAAGLLRSGCDVPLAILPLGTGNDAGHGVGVPDWPAALAALAGERECRLDVIDCTFTVAGGRGRRPALIGIGLGLSAAVLTRCTERVKRALGRWSYQYAGVMTALTYRATRLRLELDDQVLRGEYLTAAVANLEYTAGHSVRMAPGAVGDDGWLDLVLIRERSRPARLDVLLRASSGAALTVSGVEQWRARRVRVVSDPPVWLNLDGDLVGTTPATFAIRPAALRVRVP